MTATLNDLLLVLVHAGRSCTATSTYPDGVEVFRGLYVTATLNDLLLVFVQRLEPTLIMRFVFTGGDSD